MAEFPPGYPHGDIEEIADNIFMVRGSIKLNPVIRITRNMAMIRNADELSIINPLRLSSNGEAQLKALGKVTNIIRLGAFHGVDDPYYIGKFNAQMWAQAGGTTYSVPEIDVNLSETAELPFAGGKLFNFEGTVQPESALLMDTEGGLLLTCDAIQHYGDYSYNNLLARLVMPFMGFPRTTIVGPIWLKLMTPEGGNLEAIFHKLLELRFNQLLAGHGTLLSDGAHGSVAVAVDKAFQTK